MSQAKTLSEKELKILLACIATNRHASRDRAMIFTSFWSGMRVGEIAALRVSDVVASDGSIFNQINLRAEQTKGSFGRVVMISDRLRNELRKYVDSVRFADASAPLFYSQRSRNGFSANTLCQHFHTIYRNAGLIGATSHSGRRTFITNLANKSVNVRVLAALAGHKNIATTQRYIDINDDMLKNAVNLI